MASFTLPRFTRAEIVFSLKSFGAAMLAMYLASRAGLPRPFWALMTAYIVAHPLAGAVRSKALFRFLGTLVGCTATVLLVPLLSNAPELLTLALALWVGLCLFVSLLDRTPRSYTFMLAGYTAALIGFPSVETPLQLFDTGVARVEEIGLGILCATLVHSLVLPTGLASSVLGLLDRTLKDARTWTADLLQPGRKEGRAPADAQALAADRRRLAVDVTQLRLLSTHVPFDTTHLRWTAGAIRAMQDRVAALTPTLSAVEDRLQALEEAEGALPPVVVAALGAVHAWLQERAGERSAAPGTEAGPPDRLDAALRALEARPAGTTDWVHALQIGLAVRLRELVDGWSACARLRRDIDAGLTGAALPLRRTAALGDREMHRDYGMALLSALAAVLAICLCGAFWIVTGWPSGSVAAMMAAVFCCFFATMDDPVPAMHGFLKFTLWSVPISAVYVLVLMPGVQDFGMLVLVCAPTFLVLGGYMARSAHFMGAMALLFGVSGALALHDTANADLVSFANSMVGQVLGVVAAARVTRLVRSVGADWSARRIQRATWRELADMAAAPRLQDAGDAYAVRMLDRIGLLAPRIAQTGGSLEGVIAADALQDLRMGADIVALQRTRTQLPPGSASGVAALLAEVSAFFRSRANGVAHASPPLLARIDTALAGALDPAAAHRSTGWRAAVAALVGLRRNLFPAAPAVLMTTGPQAPGAIP
ncbi:FUSC family protein [Paracidovorax wautersii]|uniref:Membrane protein YccC n=1 Tax=Paracidovorax wautersii TaxID=1177982 RepID=A0ABU1IAI7_9BURK|nr:FUSC family protein [Paracidovorax wautersii]MDR6214219.1 putative membrane protein YccC [Paracidovorax wautersii]